MLKINWLFIWLIFVAGTYLIPWWNKVYFLWDDIELLMQLRSPTLTEIFSSHQYQSFPVFKLFYSLEIVFFGPDPSAFLAVSVGLHLINIWLIYILINKLTKSAFLALISSILVSFNKSYFTVIYWPTIQSSLLLTTFLLLSFLQFINLKKDYRLSTLIMFTLFMLLAELSFGFGIGAGLIFATITLLFWRKNPNKNFIVSAGIISGLISILEIIVMSTSEIQKDQILIFSPTRIFNIIYFTLVGVSQGIINRFLLPGFIPNIYNISNVGIMIMLPISVFVFFYRTILTVRKKPNILAPLFLFLSFTIVPYFIASLARSGPGALGGLAERYIYLPFFAFIPSLTYGLWLLGFDKKTFPRLAKVTLIGYIPLVAIGHMITMFFEINSLFLP